MSLLVFGVGLWFVIVFTRPATLASFVPPGQSIAASSPVPRCPIPLALLAGFYVMGGIISVLLLRIPDRTPDVFFAHALFAAQRIQYVLITSGLGIAAAVGLFRVKSWAIHLAIGLELFSVLNHAVNLLHPKAIEAMRAALAGMAAQGAKLPLRDPTLGFRYLEGLGLSFALILLLILLSTRRPFLRAASVPAALP